MLNHQTVLTRLDELCRSLNLPYDASRLTSMKLSPLRQFVDSENVFVDLSSPPGALHVVWDEDWAPDKPGRWTQTSAQGWRDFPVYKQWCDRSQFTHTHTHIYCVDGPRVQILMVFCPSLFYMINNWTSVGPSLTKKQDIWRHQLRLLEFMMGIFPYCPDYHQISWYCQ